MRWDDTDCGDNGMQRTISKRSCDAMRSDEMGKISIQKAWYRNGKAPDCCCEAQEACLSTIGTVVVPLYRLVCRFVSNFRRTLVELTDVLQMVTTCLRSAVYHLEPDDPDQAFLDICGMHGDGSLEVLKKLTCVGLSSGFVQHLRAGRVCARLHPKVLETSPAWLG